MAFREYDLVRAHRERVAIPGEPNSGQTVDATAVADLDSQDRTPHLIESGTDALFPADGDRVLGGNDGVA